VGWLAAGACLIVAACSNGNSGGTATPAPTPTPVPTPTPTPTPLPVTGVTSTQIAKFAAPWSFAFLPDGRMLVTERPASASQLLNPIDPGRFNLVDTSGNISVLSGLPANVGLLDVKIDPGYSTNHQIYVSFMERDPTAPRAGRSAADPSVDPAGLALARATLTVSATGVGQISDVRVIWRQAPKTAGVAGSGEPGGRIAFSPDGKYLFLTAGDRQELDPWIQRLDNTLGKVIRIFPDGSIPPDNPYVGRADALPEIWTFGHRNPYGLAFDAAGQLWENEMGPAGGDELNLLVPKANFGWPLVSYGNHYDGGGIPKPSPGDGFVASALVWTPVIAPSDMLFYRGSHFGNWNGDAILTGLQSKGLVRVRITGTTATEVQRIDMGVRIRAIEEAPDGALWVLEDQPSGRLLRLAPVF